MLGVLGKGAPLKTATSMVLGLFNLLQIFWQLCLIELLGNLTGLRLLRLRFKGYFGDYLSGYLSHGEKVPLEKTSKYYIGLKHQKMTFGERGWVWKCPCSQVNDLLFPELPFYVLLCAKCCFISWNCFFVSQKYFFIPQKLPIVLQNCPLVFLTYFLFFYCVYLFARMLIVPFPSFCSELLREIIFALLLFCFLL